jgi:hypothetical protein
VALRIIEFFGFDPADQSAAATASRHEMACPFVGGKCSKTLSDGTPSGACTVAQTAGGPVVCCPNRLYGNSYQVLRNVSHAVFGGGFRLIRAEQAARLEPGQRAVAVFGKRWGKELRLPQRRRGGNYFVDWILALVAAGGVLEEFVAVEVQAIDTTGNYRDQRAAFLKGSAFSGYSAAGLNWENVNKRILPQIIYKGHVLRREPLCQKGLFFVCPTPVYQRIRSRLGELMEYPPQAGALTFHWYGLGPAAVPGGSRGLSLDGRLTTTIDQVARAFTAPESLPPSRVYEQAIQAELNPKNG